ncbi:MAG TPA: tetratricopeptide repeat protein [Acidobacteriaceae bacterium]|jgi:tetratricopeptide (TPR) repeat protein
MAHAFYAPTAATTVDSPARTRDFVHAASATFYSMVRDGDHFAQKRWQQGMDGKPENVDELSIDYVMGSGNHVRTYLHKEQDGTLIELPVAWYAEDGGHWGMNPGFDNAHPMTRRVIAYECIFCHNAYPRIPPTLHRDLSAEPVYTGTMPQGIDCQRCHGPGAAHVRAAQNDAVSLDKVRAAIFQPTRSSRERQMEVCEQCHLETTSHSLPDRIRRYTREPFGYRAGEPLTEFNLYFDKNDAADNRSRFEIVNGAYRLRQSQCFLKSSNLTCETCHNPHDLHKGPQAAGYYTAICMKCHQSRLPQMIAAHKHPANNDCVSCHMPKRRTDDVVHAVMTDHLIQRTAPPSSVLLAAKQEIPETPATAYHGQVVPYMLDGEQRHPQDAAYEAVAQVIDNSNPAVGIPELATLLHQSKPAQPNFFTELGDAQRHQGELDAAIASYRDALSVDPLSSRAQRRLGAALGNSGKTAEALAVLDQAIHQEPDNPLLRYEKALVESKNGQLAQAVDDLKKCLALKPGFSDAENNLGSNLARMGDLSGAEAAFLRAMQVDPYESKIRSNAGRNFAARGEWPQAVFQLQRAVALDDSNFDAHLDLAIAFMQTVHPSQAEAEAHSAVRVNARSASAHDLLGQIVLSQGRRNLALDEFKAALAIDPSFASAELDEGELLLASGNKEAALPLLQRAAQAPQPAIAERARELLTRH